MAILKQLCSMKVIQCYLPNHPTLYNENAITVSYVEISTIRTTFSRMVDYHTFQYVNGDFQLHLYKKVRYQL